MLPKSDMEILSQEINDEDGYYRLRTGLRVRYLTISVGTFDDDTMCRPYLLIPNLPDLPDSPWTTMTISRDEDGSLTSAMSMDPLPEIRTAWHEQRVDVLTLKKTRRFRSGVHEVQYDAAPAIANIACFEWEIARIERETIMGLLLEKLDGEPACVDDLANCEALLHRLHQDLRLVHGDVNRHNFVVDRVSGSGVRLVDYEHAQDFDESLAKEELLSLPAELAEETGRGATVVRK